MKDSIEKKEEDYKYKVWVSGRGTIFCDTEDEVDAHIGSGSVGSLYEVRNPKDDSFYSEFVPF